MDKTNRVTIHDLVEDVAHSKEYDPEVYKALGNIEIVPRELFTAMISALQNAMETCVEAEDDEISKAEARGYCRACKQGIISASNLLYLFEQPEGIQLPEPKLCSEPEESNEPSRHDT